MDATVPFLRSKPGSFFCFFGSDPCRRGWKIHLNGCSKLAPFEKVTQNVLKLWTIKPTSQQIMLTEKNKTFK